MSDPTAQVVVARVAIENGEFAITLVAFPEVFRAFLQETGCTMGDVQRGTGVSKSVISGFLAGTKCQSDTLIKLANWMERRAFQERNS